MISFTKIPNHLLDSSNDLTNAQLRVLLAIYRLTIGFQRNQYRIAYKTLSIMTGVKNIYNIIQVLREKEFIHTEFTKGDKQLISIHTPTNSVTHPHSLSYTPPLTQLHGFRRAKENTKENLKKDNLFVEFKELYPEERFGMEKEVYSAWATLTEKELDVLAEVMQYQKNEWDNMDDRKYIVGAKRYLKERKFLEGNVYAAYKQNQHRKNEKKKFNERYTKNKEIAASSEDIEKILNEWNKK